MCHKNCLALINVSCNEQQVLRTTKPTYFMATDPTEKKRWIQGLEFHRKEVEKIGAK